MATGTSALEWGSERARAGPWRGDGFTAYLTPSSPDRQPSAGFLLHCLDRLRADGYRRVITPAVARHERRTFVSAGFTELERLVLLSHDLTGVGTVPGRRGPAGVRLRRGGVADHPGVVRLDSVAFRPFWQLDSVGLLEAIGATPAARFRVAAREPQGLVGYCVAGRSRQRGYLQRLAVDPLARRQGVGRALVGDALAWLRRWGADTASVNTQEDNADALGLYLRLGFRVDGPGLWVMQIELA